MKRRKTIHPDFDIVKDNLRNVFKELRKNNFVAKMNFSCCGGCGSYECSQIAREKGKTKVVFYHRQNEETLKFYDGTVYLHYYSTDDNDENTIQVGKEIVDIVKKYPEITTEWSGSPGSCIKISKKCEKGDVQNAEKRIE
jgi:hypothetical protein